MKKYLLLASLAVSASAFAQQNNALTIDDAVLNRSLNPKQLYGLQWIPNTDAFTWSGTAPAGEALVKGTAKDAKIDTILRSQDVVADAKRMPSITWMNKDKFWLDNKGKITVYNIVTKAKEEVNSYPETAENTDIDTNHLYVAYTKGNNLYITKAGKESQITFETNEAIVNGQAAHRSEFGITKGTFWSPKGNLLAWYRMDQTMVTDYPLVDLSTYPAKTTPIKYPMAGQTSHLVTLGVYNVATGSSLFIQTGELKDQYLTNVCFSPDEKSVFMAIVNRDQNQMKLNEYDAASGAFVKTLFEEKQPRYVEPEEPMLFIPKNNKEFVWESERSGTNQLYLYDRAGKLVKQLTNGDFTVTKNYGWDAAGKFMTVQLSTKNGMDRSLVAVDGKGNMKPITTLSGTYNAIPQGNGAHCLTTFNNLTTANEVNLFSLQGKPVRGIYKAPNPVLKYNMPTVEFVSLKASDSTVLNGRIIKPLNMVAGKKYPVIVYLYGGPHAQMVTNSWQAGANNWMMYMATKGYIVFTMDNRGSSGRGQKFEDVVHNHLGTIQMEDQMVGVNYLKALPYVDASRMGIHGWSFGGFMTTTMMTRQPDVFKAGVAGGPVIDWALYEVMYTERYMDTPKQNREGYDESNLLKYVPSLKGRLMLIHGTIDDVVVWQHSQLFVQECVKKGKLIDYMVYPGHKHNVNGKDRLHLMRTITQYFEDHL